MIPVFTVGYDLNDEGIAEILVEYNAPPPDDVNEKILERIMKMATISLVPEWLISENPDEQQAGRELLGEIVNNLDEGG